MVGVCVVETCYSKKTSLHRFPNPSKNLPLYSKWLELCGNNELFNLPPAMVYANRRVCRLHFVESDFGPNNRLLPTAYPRLNLPAAASIQPLQVESTPQQQYGTDSMPQTTLHSPLPSTSGTETSIDVSKSVLPSPVLSTDISQTPTTSRRIAKTPRRQCGLLAHVGATRIKHLSPKAQLLFQEAKTYKKKYAVHKKTNLALQRRLKKATSYASSEEFKRLFKHLDATKINFFQSQLRNAKRKRTGRRFNLQDKILALALYKQSGNGYKLLSNLFALPSRKTLNRLLQDVYIVPGLNKVILEVLKDEVSSFKNSLDKYCVLTFDEMSIQPHLDWDGSVNAVVGFENVNYRTTNLIANHVQVFMLRGINKKWKQPIYFSFINGAMKNINIVKIIKEIVREVKHVGLEIIATVCDQATNNVAAIKALVDDTAAAYTRRGETLYDYVFDVDGSIITPLFDVPHLMKGIRNNFIKGNIQFMKDGKMMTAKWEHIYKGWQIDGTLGAFRTMPKLTTAHVDPQYIKKMKVSNCTQVLSRSVAVAINLMAVTGACIELDHGKICMPAEAAETAEFIHFCDQLFDSVNGSKRSDAKKLKCRVSDETEHIQFWRSSIKVLETVKFITGRGPTVPPTIKNFISTLKNFMHLYQQMRKLGFSYMQTRTFNQDCLENFFGRIRQRGVRFTNPTAAAFIPFYKSLLVNNFTARHSPGSNCEDDKNNILTTLDKLLKQGSVENTRPAVNISVEVSACSELRDLEANVAAYVAGFVTKKLSAFTKNCEVCRENILAGNISEEYLQFTKLKEYDGARQRLHYVNKKLYEAICEVYSITRTLLPQIIYKEDFYLFLIKYCQKINFNFKECDHSNKVICIIIKRFIKTVTFNYIKHVNRILTRKDVKKVGEATDIVFKQAILLCKSSKIIK